MYDEQLPMLVASQAVLWCGLALALYFVHRLGAEFPSKKWRWAGVMAWLTIGFFASIIETAAIIIGCSSLPVMRMLVWIDRVILMVSYLAIAMTMFQIVKFYRERCYDS